MKNKIKIHNYAILNDKCSAKKTTLSERIYPSKAIRGLKQIFHLKNKKLKILKSQVEIQVFFFLVLINKISKLHFCGTIFSNVYIMLSSISHSFIRGLLSFGIPSNIQMKWKEFLYKVRLTTPTLTTHIHNSFSDVFT